MKLRALALMALISQLSGCTTYISMFNDKNVPAPATPPKIILGETASYWGTYSGLDKEIIDNWRQTGLFKEVLVTNNAVPPVEGTFIHTDCEVFLTDNQSDFLVDMTLGIMFITTLGMLPVGGDTEVHACTTKFYQNGVALNESYSRYHYNRMWGSWVGWLLNSNEKVIREGRVTAASNIVSTQLASLKKAYP
ncbi:hypothetical protein [Pseudomonas fluorescens]|uniref:Lipoprotein n=1 Tax=Pseudomonas fluorescens TaxID=294 RepID=A0A5E7VET4_PSEFL|nr:hypothetical protein [Pseudomonas fluorescens]VVQ20568.1 hypothetical protein PS928_05021 [Pseudomonas fluorescens]